MNAQEYIKSRIPEAELLAGLAEEASELAQAALKLRRVLDGTNPTPVTYEQAKSALIEESADVSLMLALVLGFVDIFRQGEIADRKCRRWKQRLMEAEQKE